jgi:hypothetical protein
MSCLGMALNGLERYDESIAMLESALLKYTATIGEDAPSTLNAMVGLASVQCHSSLYYDSKRTAGRGLLIAKRVGEEKPAAAFADVLSRLEKVEEAKSATYKQMLLQVKIEVRRQAKEKAAADEVARVANAEPPMTDDDIDNLMAEFAALDDGGGKKKSNAGGGGGKKKGKKGGKKL